MIDKSSPIYEYWISPKVSNKCLLLADNIINTVPLHSTITQTPYISINDKIITIEWVNDNGEFSLYVHDKQIFYVEWAFSIGDVYIEGIFNNLSQIIYTCQNSSFGGHL
jgi:hypothetical protein